MKKVLVSLLLCSWGIFLFVSGCGQQPSSTQPSGDKGGSSNPITVSDLFNVSGAKAILAASSTKTSGSAVKSLQSSNVTELLKLTTVGTIESVFSNLLSKNMHPPIRVIETGPDGSLFVGFDWGIWISGTTETEGKQVAFFRITTDGAVESVDSSIYGVGSWYGYSENGELPVKQVQFVGTASSYDIYYIGKTSTGLPILKKKSASGTITQIGSSSSAVRDFLVASNGMVFFHGSKTDWSNEWLRVYKDSSVYNIFYNDGNSGWLRAYYAQITSNKNYVFLIGQSLTLLDANEVPQKYSGIIRVALDANGKPTEVKALYDDNNMYSETYSSLGSQMTWGYWDPVEMTTKKIFVTDNYGSVQLPLSLEAGVTEASIREFIRKHYFSRTTDTLDSLTFAGKTTSESWRISNMIDDLINANVSGKTWGVWREENGLTGVSFGNAKQLVFTASGELYAVMKLDNWGGGTTKGDKLFRIVNASGEAETVAYLQDTTNYYKSMSKVRAYGNYAIYLSQKVGLYKILRLDLSNPTVLPVDMIPGKSNIEIFSFDYNTDTGMLFYDVYDLSNNTSYLAQQAITSIASTTVSAEGYTITDVVAFTATK